MSDRDRAGPGPSSVTSKPEPFRWMAADAYLFDIDGTLLNTKDLIHYRALNRAMQEVYGADITIDGIPYHGKTDLGILRAALARVGISGAAFESRLPLALGIVRDDVERNAAGFVPNVCAAIPEVLRRLQRAGKILGVASGNLEVVGWHKVKAAGLREFFSFGCFSDHCETRVDVFRRAVEQVQQGLRREATVCFIGDTPADIEAARKLGAWVIAVGTGVYKVQDLLGYGPDLCVASCSELLERVGE